MNPPAKLKWGYALVVVVLLLFSVQLSAYVARALADGGRECALFAFAESGLILGYALARAIWRTAAQAYLTRKWLRRFRSDRDGKLTRRLAYRYRDLGTELIVTRDDGLTALAIGMRKPIIVLSRGVLERFGDDEVKAIVLHEWHHCRNRDNAKLFLARLLTEAFGFLPIMRPMFRYYRTWTELLADRFAMNRMGTELPLAGVLLKLSKLGGMRPYPAAVHFAATTMNYRIAQVLEPDRTVKVKLNVLRPLLTSLTLLLLLLLSGDS